MALDWSKCPAVESVPGKVSGAWVFRGTRMPVAAVFENLEDGLTIDEIVEMFDGLTREQVQAVLDFQRKAWKLLRAPANARAIRSGYARTNPEGFARSYSKDRKTAGVEHTGEWKPTGRCRRSWF